jgi:ABC-type transport system involved in cytochrome c biogenesis permease subunit
MEITNFNAFAILCSIIWTIGTLFLFVSKQQKLYKIAGEILIPLGIAALAFFILDLWISLERAPFRTKGETRLWYSFFLAVVSYITYVKWKYRWFLVYGLLMSIMFLIFNMLKPEYFDKTLMPALQSYWFVPHVIVYMLSYALLGGATLVALKGTLFFQKFRSSEDEIFLADNFVYIGFGFLTMGLLFGALWAKQAWGHYWTWDPKEIWAMLTWICYLIYIHFRFKHATKIKTAFWMLNITFIVLLITWFWLRYIPAAQESIHVYSN